MHKFCIFLLLIFALGCKTKNNTPDKVFMPYSILINDEVEKIIANPRAISLFHLDSSGKKLDSVYMEINEFKLLVKNFTEPNISDKKWKKYYTESVYGDASNNSFNFSYSTQENTAPIKEMILTTSKENESKLISLLVFKNYTKDSATIEEKLYWKADEYCQINTTTTIEQKSKTEIRKVEWGLIR
jgi:hypothetical protein